MLASKGLIVLGLPSPDIEEVVGGDWNGRNFSGLFIQDFE